MTDASLRAAGHGAAGEAEVCRWIGHWLRAVHGLEFAADDDLLGALDSLALAELLVAVESEFGTALDEGFALDRLATVRTLAAHVAASCTPSPRIWLSTAARPQRLGPGRLTAVRDQLAPGAVAARTASNGLSVGLRIAADGADGGNGADRGRPAGKPRPDDGIETDSGSLLAYGRPARAAALLTARLEELAARLEAVPVWYPILTNAPTGRDHPQRVTSSHTGGRLGHAACLQLLTALPADRDRTYCGVGFAFRHEPARRWDVRGRLEAYRVHETVVAGGADYRARRWAVLREAVDELLSGYVTGGWQEAEDGFTPGMERKLEWVADTRGGRAALASLNDHADSFTRAAGSGSFCLGVGVDRMVDLGVVA